MAGFRLGCILAYDGREKNLGKYNLSVSNLFILKLNIS